ncbi:hypothetical protein J7K28_05370 [Candidatus Aerophobetes bacterium]|nr:hypothetical protein [Candidatus Aerophobetes bacterium]
MQPKIGFIVAGHRDYPNDVGINMARKAVEELKKKNIEVIFFDQPQLDSINARKTAIRLISEDVDGVVFFLGTWIEAPVAIAALREVEHLPIALWGFPMFKKNSRLDSTGSLVALFVLQGTLRRMGIPFKSIMGTTDDKKAISQVISFSRASCVKKALKRTRLGLVGYASMGMYPGTFDHALLRKIIGPEVIHLDNYLLINKTIKVSKIKMQDFISKLNEKATVEGVPQEVLEKAARLYQALKELIDGYQLNAVNLKCQYELSQVYGCIPCVPMSLLSDEGIVCSCEGDVLTGITMVVLNYLSNQAIYYGDVLDFRNQDILLSSCGFAPFSLANPRDKIKVREIGHPGFNGPICSFTLKRGKLTLARLNEKVGDYTFLFTCGEGMETELRQGRFPALRIKLNTDVQEFLYSLESQHLAMCYGDWTQELFDLCHFLNIKANKL